MKNKGNCSEEEKDEDYNARTSRQKSVTEINKKCKNKPRTNGPQKKRTTDREAEYIYDTLDKKDKYNKSDSTKYTDLKKNCKPFCTKKCNKKFVSVKNADSLLQQSSSIQEILNRYLTKYEFFKNVKDMEESYSKESNRSSDSMKQTCSKRCHFPCSKESNENISKVSSVRFKVTLSNEEKTPSQSSSHTCKYSKPDDIFSKNIEKQKNSIDISLNCPFEAEIKKNGRKLGQIKLKKNDNLNEHISNKSCLSSCPITDNSKSKKLSTGIVKQSFSFTSISSDEKERKSVAEVFRSRSGQSEELLPSKCFSETSNRSKTKTKNSLRPTTAPGEYNRSR